MHTYADRHTHTDVDTQRAGQDTERQGYIIGIPMILKRGYWSFPLFLAEMLR